jgi:transcriptional regulator with XRE-family HTH domain
MPKASANFTCVPKWAMASDFVMASLSTQRYLCEDFIFLSSAHNPNMETIGQRVRALRTSRRLTQVQLAERVGINQGALSALETKQDGDITGTTLAALCRELHTTAEYLVFGLANGMDPEHILMEAELLATFRRLPGTAKEALIATARGLAAVQPPSAVNPFPKKRTKA